jgi:caffeoyl-CoA O-methyltransferase
VVAETFTVAWRRIADVPLGEPARLWLFGTAHPVRLNVDTLLGSGANSGTRRPAGAGTTEWRNVASTSLLVCGRSVRPIATRIRARNESGNPTVTVRRCGRASPAAPRLRWPPTTEEDRTMQLLDGRVEDYLRSLQDRHDDPVLLEMEEEARRSGFPIVDRVVGVTLEVLARAVGARRVLEMGSGYGYSAYWFARAVGEGGEVHLTDGDPQNERRAHDFLGRAGLWDRVRYTVGDAIETLQATDGEFDVIFCDIDKGDYPRAWEVARERIRVGGVYVCDNALRAGGVDAVTRSDDRRRGWGAAVDDHNRAVAADERYLSTLLPIRDGDLVALRIR